MKDMPGEGEGGEEDHPQEMEEQKEMSQFRANIMTAMYCNKNCNMCSTQ